MGEIQKVSVRHEAIMDYLMANPLVKMGDVAKSFGVTQSWLSQVVHSDAFQNLLREKQDVAFHDTVLPVREKMMAVAHLALDRLSETLPLETETRTLSSVAESVLDRLGFGTKSQPPAPSVHLHQHVHMQRESIEAARALIGAKVSPSPREVHVNGERAPIGLGAPETIPAEDLPGLCQAPALPAPISTANPEAFWTEAAARLAVREEGS